MSTALTAKQAEKLWSQLQQHFINAGRVIEEIISTKAWEPLGYASFAEAWAERMGDITLAAEVRPHVVYQMYAEGHDEEFVEENVKGVGPAAAKAYKRQRSNGVPASLATNGNRGNRRSGTDKTDKVVVPQYERGKPSKPTTLHIGVGQLMYRELGRLAKQHGCSMEEFVLGLIDSGLNGLKRKRSA